MRNDNSHNLNAFDGSDKDKNKQLLLNFIRRTIEKETKSTIKGLKNSLTQKELYRLGLYFVTTTNKAICEALDIPVEAGTRRKRQLEKEGKLIASRKKRTCPLTKDFAKFLSTNPNNYKELLK